MQISHSLANGKFDSISQSGWIVLQANHNTPWKVRLPVRQVAGTKVFENFPLHLEARD